MASLTKTNGKRGTTWRIEFYLGDEAKRKCIRLGKIDKRQAESIKARVELLVAANITCSAPDVETSRWVMEQDDEFHAKLAKKGLVAKRGKAASNTLAAFLDAYIESRTDIKPNTRAHLKRARNNLVSHFGADKSLAEISPGDTDDFRLHLQTTMADNTVRRICGRAKQFFRAAVRKRLIAESPFADMKGTGVRANKSRDYFVTRDDAAKVLNACPDAQWKLLFVLSRFGGLRCPSEHLELRWGDVDWDRERITVRSPKTAHLQGHEERDVPLFPELRSYLEAVRDELFADPNFDPKAKRLSEQPIITRYRDRNSNLRTQLERIIGKAGLQPWPKLFQNLRATRATELADQFPGHVAADWLGHSMAIADKHYRQTTDEHFARATAGAQDNGVAAEPTQKAQQIAQQSASESGGNDRHGKEGERETHEKSRGPRKTRKLKAPPVGLEGNPFALGLRGICRVDTWETGNVPQLFHFSSPFRTATVWHPKGLRVARVVSELCRRPIRRGGFASLRSLARTSGATIHVMAYELISVTGGHNNCHHLRLGET